ncbi:MAG: NADH-quinone oxidoreductase subunit H, partial [Caldisericia bacterium]|nr:NADH-quinone oxidoreductase subunit H [Caldisericia bacterium]
MNTLFNYLIFPGFLFTSIAGLALNWIDRKLTARIQWRVGPPWYQPLFDVLKLFGKEITIPKEGKDTLFLIAPFFSLGAIVFASTLLLLPNFISSSGFAGDLIVILYLLMIPGISTILGGASSANPLASLGVSREIKLMISYELPLVLAIFTPVIKTSGIITIDGLLKYQLTNGIMLKNPSCIIAFLVAIICIQAKLGSVPFDQSEAETEIMAGAYIEYSGLPLAIFKLSKMMLTFIAPILL